MFGWDIISPVMTPCLPSIVQSSRVVSHILSARQARVRGKRMQLLPNGGPGLLQRLFTESLFHVQFLICRTRGTLILQGHVEDPKGGTPQQHGAPGPSLICILKFHQLFCCGACDREHQLPGQVHMMPRSTWRRYGRTARPFVFQTRCTWPRCRSSTGWGTMACSNGWTTTRPWCPRLYRPCMCASTCRGEDH